MPDLETRARERCFKRSIDTSGRSSGKWKETTWAITSEIWSPRFRAKSWAVLNAARVPSGVVKITVTFRREPESDDEGLRHPRQEFSSSTVWNRLLCTTATTCINLVFGP